MHKFLLPSTRAQGKPESGAKYRSKDKRSHYIILIIPAMLAPGIIHYTKINFIRVSLQISKLTGASVNPLHMIRPIFFFLMTDF